MSESDFTVDKLRHLLWSLGEAQADVLLNLGSEGRLKANAHQVSTVAYCMGFEVALELAMLQPEIARQMIALIHESNMEMKDTFNEVARTLLHRLQCPHH